MYTKKIKYEDFNGKTREETFYFHISTSEITEKNWRTPGGIEEYYKRILETEDPDALVDIFKGLILDTIGIKSEDGKRFVKSKEISEAFSQTNAYDKLFMELAFNSDSAAEFINNIFPKEIVERAQKQKEMAEKAGLHLAPNETPAAPAPQVDPTFGVPVANPIQGLGEER